MAMCPFRQVYWSVSFGATFNYVAIYLTNRRLTSCYSPVRFFELFLNNETYLTDFESFGCSVTRIWEVAVKKLNSKAVYQDFASYGRSHDSQILYYCRFRKMSFWKIVSFRQRVLFGLESFSSKSGSFVNSQFLVDFWKDQVKSSSNSWKPVVGNSESRDQKIFRYLRVFYLKFNSRCFWGLQTRNG